MLVRDPKAPPVVKVLVWASRSIESLSRDPRACPSVRKGTQRTNAEALRCKDRLLMLDAQGVPRGFLTCQGGDSCWVGNQSRLGPDPETRWVGVIYSSALYMEEGERSLPPTCLKHEILLWLQPHSLPCYSFQIWVAGPLRWGGGG